MLKGGGARLQMLDKKYKVNCIQIQTNFCEEKKNA